MRIAFVVNNYPPRVGGVENHVAALARQLVAQGHDVVVHTLSQAPGPVSIEHGVRVRRWHEWFQVGGLLGFPTPGAACGIARALRAERPDLISVHTRFFPLTWLGAALGRVRGVPVLHTEHGSDHVASPSPMIRWGSRVVDLTLGRWSLRAAARVVGVSDEVVAFVKRLSGVDADVFHNAIEPPVDTDPAAGTRRHLVFVGRIVPGKGWEDFLDVVAALPADVTAEVVGDGPDFEELTDRVRSLGLDARVTVRGRVPLVQVFEALRGAVLVNPTRLSEGFQTTLIEALAVGARVVTYPVPGAGRLTVEDAPIVTTAREVPALVAAVAASLDHPAAPWPAAAVEGWTWPARAGEYAALAASVVEAQRSR